MGDIKGFTKHNRSLPGVELAETRIEHFQEFVKPVKEDHQIDQAARCMDCGIPFCHNACPLGNVIPEFNEAVYQKDWASAFKTLMSTNNFPEFTGRICPAPCEASCVLGINEEAVTIEYIEKSIIEKAYENGWVQPNIPSIRTGKNVAIVGSGPAGLACADQLNQKGHRVTVYEKNAQPGGLLRYGIPDFKLAKSVVERRLSIMEAEEINFKTNVNVGADLSVTSLILGHDAVVLCGGSEHPRDLNIEGRQFQGVHFAMEFLKQCNEQVSGISTDNHIIDVSNKNVVVIGGGDTGSDCIGNSKRNGANLVTQIEIMGKPPVNRSEDNPWPLWPMTLKTTSSHEEGCAREWAMTTKRFLSEDGAHLSGIEVARVHWKKDELGRFQMTEIPDTTEIIPCEYVFIAAGFLHPVQAGLLQELNLELDQRGNVLTEEYKSSANKIFSAGDMRRGQSLVVWAIAEGRECAEKVHDFLTPKEIELTS